MATIFAFAGPSAAGKTSVVRELLQENVLRLVPSNTTRMQRESDLPGEYEYVSSRDFRYLAARDEFLWRVQYAGAHYGTKKEDLNMALNSPQPHAMILVPKAIETLRGFTDNCVAIGIVAPEQTVYDRLVLRGDDRTDIEKRMQTYRDMRAEIENPLKAYHVFENRQGKLDSVVCDVKNLILHRTQRL